jgi:chorismate mutase
VLDVRRESSVLANVRKEARGSRADAEFLDAVYRALLKASRAYQKRWLRVV